MYFISHILLVLGFLIVAEVRLVPGDDERRVELEEMVVTFLDGPREWAVAQVDGVQVRAETWGGRNGVLSLSDGHVHWNTRYEPWQKMTS